MMGAWALVRATWQSASSYRVRLILSIGGLLVSVIPLYFVTGALQPVMAESIQGEAPQYFSFVLIGTIAFSFVTSAVTTLPSEVGSGITTGIFEALLSTRTRLPTLMVGMSGYSLIWITVRGLITLLVGWLLGAEIAWAQLPEAFVVVVLIVLAHVPFGILGAALMLSFRTSGPLAQGVLFVSAALGGLYYPTQVIPSWLEQVSGFVPLTYGLTALRRILLLDESLLDVSGELLALSGFAVLLLSVSGFAFWAAFRYARRAGTLTQY